MKLVRYGLLGAEKPGLVDEGGTVRDLSRHVLDIEGETISPESHSLESGKRLIEAPFLPWAILKDWISSPLVE